MVPLNVPETQDREQGQQSRQRYQPLQIRIARTLMDFARGHPNTRSQQRRNIQTKIEVQLTETVSRANPINLPNTLEEKVRPQKLDVILRRNPLSQAEMESHAWNPTDKSVNIYVKDEDRLTFHRLPIAQSTDCIRAKVAYSRGFHVWKLIWPVNQRGSHPMVGVATKDFVLHSIGYSSLLGSDEHSYGWNINENICYHDSKKSRGWGYPGADPNFTLPTEFYCILDMDEGYMAFATKDRYLGVAFCGLKGEDLFPVVSVVWGHSEVTINYLGGLERTFSL